MPPLAPFAGREDFALVPGDAAVGGPAVASEFTRGDGVAVSRLATARPRETRTCREGSRAQVADE